MFLWLMIIGLTGLATMALPALGHFTASGHGGAHLTGHGAHGASALHGAGTRGAGVHGHAAARVSGGRALAGHARGAIGSRGADRQADPIIPADVRATSKLRFIPSPRAIFSVLALFGAFGNALVHAARLDTAAAAAIALVLALAVEKVVVKPVWNLLFRFQGEPSSPLEALVMSEARAVVPFRNGRGVISVVRDGRLVQLSARLSEDDAGSQVEVGDRLRIEDVDSRNERVTVSTRWS